MDKEDTAVMSVVFLVALGLYWGLPKETIYICSSRLLLRSLLVAGSRTRKGEEDS